MPTQVLIRHLKKPAVVAEIKKLKAESLLDLVDQGNATLVVCKQEGPRDVEGSAAAVQKLADIDAALARKWAAENDDEPAPAAPAAPDEEDEDDEDEEDEDDEEDEEDEDDEDDED